MTVVGLMPEVHVGSVLSLGGNWKVDAKYGRQFSADTFEETLPATVFGIEKYLGSGLIKGIGPMRTNTSFTGITLNFVFTVTEPKISLAVSKRTSPAS